MKNYKRMASVLALGLLATTLTACGANKTDNSASSSSTVKTSQKAADTLVGAYQNTQGYSR